MPHNISYWQGQDYLGLGPGAVSCLSGVRSKNFEDISVYEKKTSAGIKPADTSETEVLTMEQQISEFMMLGLRTAEGVDTEWFARKFGEMSGLFMAGF
jgi:oxygen-independent coproporphyrinogen-3 oxidase